MQRKIMLALSAAAALLGATLAAKATTLPGPNTGAAMCPSFHEVHPSMTAKEALRARTPTGFKLYPSFDPRDETLDETLLVREVPFVSGGEIANAKVDLDERTKEPVVAFRFNDAGTIKLGDFTSRNVGRPFAILLDNHVISAPVISEPIVYGIGRISGRFTVAEAERLAAKMNSGTCPRVATARLSTEARAVTHVP